VQYAHSAIHWGSTATSNLFFNDKSAISQPIYVFVYQNDGLATPRPVVVRATFYLFTGAEQRLKIQFSAIT
jgi:hypothetical protein